MGGGDSQTTTTNQNQSQNYNQLQNLIENLATQGTSNLTSQGTTAQNTSQQQAGTTTGTSASQTGPWAAALPAVNNLLTSLQGMSTQLTPAQQRALGSLQTAAGGIPSFGPNAATAIGNEFGSVNGIPEAGIWGNAYSNLQQTMSPFTSPNWATINNPAINQLINDPLTGLNKNIATSIASEFAGSGRDPSGNQAAPDMIAKVESQTDLPILLQNQGTLAGQTQNAANAEYGAGAGTAGGITGLMQTPWNNQLAAINAAGNVPGLYMGPAQQQLGAANLGYATPLQNIGALQGLITQLAGLGQSATGQTAGTSGQTMTGTSTGQTTGQQQGATTSATQGSSQGATSGQSQGQMSGTSTTTAQPSMFNEMAGLGLGLLALSDERLKENIEPIGLLNNGLNVYKYNFKGDARPQIGVMAQEVEQVKPEAVVDVPVGGLWGSVKMVDYDQATAA